MTSCKRRFDACKPHFLSLSRARDEARDDLAQAIHDNAHAVVHQLKDYGIQPATLTTLQTRIDAYRAVVAAPQTAIAQKRTITGLLDQQFEVADAILNDRIDGLMEQFKGGSTNFYSDYQNARTIIDTGAQRPTPPAPPPTP